MQLSGQQLEARSMFRDWYDDRIRGHRTDPFFLAGCAGTGKTTAAQALAAAAKQIERHAMRDVFFCAFTGKAAHVLTRKGCPASTIHQLIYRGMGDPPSEALIKKTRELLDKQREDLKANPSSKELAEKIDATSKQLVALIDDAKETGPRFAKNPDSDIKNAALVIVDEASMLSERIGRDLESYDVPLLLLGDLGQLPPVFGAGYFTDRSPNYELTEIHRQEAGSPIIEMATAIRTHGYLPASVDAARVIPYGHPELAELCKGANQVIVGRNETRLASNARMRELLGYTGDVPQPGEKLICLRNIHDEGLLNGSMWTVIRTSIVSDDLVRLYLEEMDGDRTVNIVAWRHYFDGREKKLGMYQKREWPEFTYGYAITCHKSQGSEWDRVVVFDEGDSFGRDADRWLYTAVTRAAKSVVVVTKRRPSV